MPALTHLQIIFFGIVGYSWEFQVHIVIKDLKTFLQSPRPSVNLASEIHELV